MVKKKGSYYVSFLLGAFMVLAIMLTIIVTCLNISKAVIATTKLDIIVNEYVLRMESVGYLDSASEMQLMSELNVAGYYSVSLNGTTKTRVLYGTKIQLCVAATYDLTKFTEGTGNNVVPSQSKDPTRVEVKRKSISKS